MKNITSIAFLALVFSSSVFAQTSLDRDKAFFTPNTTAAAVKRYDTGEKPVLPGKKRPATSSTFSWTGAYIGGHVGYGWANSDTKFDPLPSASSFINLMPSTLHPDGRGFIGGVQGGYNWQSGSFVGGFEASLAFSSVNGTEIVTPIVQNNGTNFPGAGFLRAHEDTDYIGTFRARAGGAWGRTLLYGTGGLAYGKVNYAGETDFRPVGTVHYPVAFSRLKVGWTLGGGGEYAINDHWSWKGEYLYIDLGSQTTTAGGIPQIGSFQVRYTWQTKMNTFNTGFNYRW